MESLPEFDPTKFYLGKVCKRGHEWHGSGRALRRRSDRTCPECDVVRKAPFAIERAKESFARKNAYTNAIKMERGCADCGYREHPAALHFDHLPGSVKVSSVAQMCNNTSMAKLRAEIAKCEVVCANCHSIRTYERKRLALAVLDQTERRTA